MKKELAAKIRGLAAPAKPTEQQMATVLRGWDELFDRLQLPADEQEAEFDAIMRARVRAGIVSIMADKLTPETEG